MDVQLQVMDVVEHYLEYRVVLETEVLCRIMEKQCTYYENRSIRWFVDKNEKYVK
jgi:hypothetical protein